MNSQAMSSLWKFSLAAAIAALVAGCGGGGGGSGSAPVTPPPVSQTPPVVTAPVKYAVGGTVSGLGTGAALTLNFGSDKLTVAANGNFAFPNKVDTGAAYSVSASAPAGYTCRVSEAAGVVAAADVSKIGVACAPVVLAGVVSTLQLPLAVTADGAGNLYVFDSVTSSVLKYSMAGAVTVIAGGSNKPGYANGAGAIARFGPDRGDLVVDAQGNVLLADGCNNVIRKIRPDGEVSILAGNVSSLCKYGAYIPPAGGAGDGIGGQAQFALPNRMVADGAGGALVLDIQNRGILRRVSATGVVTSQYWRNPNPAEGDLTFATVALGADGTLYLSDTRRRIWKDVAGVLVFVAGQTTSGAAVDGSGPAARFRAINDMVVAPGGDLYVADSTQVRKVTPAGVVSTLAGGLGVRSGTDGQGLGAGFGSIRSIALDGAGLVVLDAAQSNLRRVGLNGTVSTLAATPASRGSVDGVGSAARLSTVVTLAADVDGNLYTIDADMHVLRKTTPEGSVSTYAGQAGVRGATDGALASALFDTPYSVAAGSDGVLWVAQAVGLRKIQNGTVSTVNAALEIADLAIDADGNPIIVDPLGQVLRVTPAGQATVLVTADKVKAMLKDPDAAFFPGGLVADKAGNLYISDTGTSLVYKLTKAGELSVFAGTVGKSSDDIDGPVGTATLGFYDYPFMTIDDKGNLYISGQGNVRMISPAGVVSTPNLGWGTSVIVALAYAKGKLYGTTRNAILQTWLP